MPSSEKWANAFDADDEEGAHKGPGEQLPGSATSAYSDLTSDSDDDDEGPLPPMREDEDEEASR